MESRTQRETLVFRHTFTLAGVPGAQPAGTYTLETEEEMIDGLSFAAWRRVATTLMRCDVAPGRPIEALAVDPRDLARAQAADAAA